MGLQVPRSREQVHVELINRYMTSGRVPSAGTKIATAQAEYRTIGYREGIAEALAAEISLMRAEMYPYASYADALYQQEVWKVLEHFRKDWGGMDRSAAEAYIRMILDALYGLAVDEHLAETSEAIRRDKVLKGEIPAVESDGEWIREEADKQRKQAEQLIALLGGVTPKAEDKVNRGSGE